MTKEVTTRIKMEGKEVMKILKKRPSKIRPSKEKRRKEWERIQREKALLEEEEGCDLNHNKEEEMTNYEVSKGEGCESKETLFLKNFDERLRICDNNEGKSATDGKDGGDVIEKGVTTGDEEDDEREREEEEHRTTRAQALVEKNNVLEMLRVENLNFKGLTFESEVITEKLIDCEDKMRDMIRKERVLGQMSCSENCILWLMDERNAHEEERLEEIMDYESGRDEEFGNVKREILKGLFEREELLRGRRRDLLNCNSKNYSEKELYEIGDELSEMDSKAREIAKIEKDEDGWDWVEENKEKKYVMRKLVLKLIEKRKIEKDGISNGEGVKIMRKLEIWDALIVRELELREKRRFELSYKNDDYSIQRYRDIEEELKIIEVKQAEVVRIKYGHEVDAWIDVNREFLKNNTGLINCYLYVDDEDSSEDDVCLGDVIMKMKNFGIKRKMIEDVKTKNDELMVEEEKLRYELKIIKEEIEKSLNLIIKLKSKLERDQKIGSDTQEMIVQSSFCCMM